MKQIAYDVMRDFYTYVLDDGRCVRLDGRMVREEGAYDFLTKMGMRRMLPLERRPVYQRGRKIGTVGPEFEPLSIRSRSPLYSPREGDFVLSGDGWAASGSLGPGDLDAIPGFIADQPGAQRESD